MGKITPNDLFQVFEILKVKSISSNDMQALIHWFDSNGSNCCDYHELTKQLYSSSSEDTSILRSSSTSALPSLGASMGKSIGATNSHIDHINLTDAALPPIPEKTASRTAMLTALNDPPSSHESRLIKEARRAIRTKTYLAEKIKLESKIAEIERQKKAIVDNYKSSHGVV